ncbi:MAG: YHS domain-containing protein [Thaumarchaeota archaeon]|nr:YHS domain-containing protein [Nitrososphaerota archaeon]
MVESIKDPVCGTEVDPEKAIRTELGGKIFYFCRAGCKATFKKAHIKNGHGTPIKVRKASRKQSGCCG